MKKKGEKDKYDLKELKKKCAKYLKERCKGKSVEIGFENVDVMEEIPYEKVKLLVANGIEEDTGLRDGRRLDMRSCKVFFIIIDGEWTKGTHYIFGMKKNGYSEERAKRLQGNDIVSFNYKEKGKAEKDIYVAWGGDNDYVNINQKSGWCSNGDLWISVCDKKAEKDLKELKKSWQCK